MIAYWQDSPERIDPAGQMRDKQIAGGAHHQHCLLLRRVDRHEVHRVTLVDCLRVARRPVRSQVGRGNGRQSAERGDEETIEQHMLGRTPVCHDARAPPASSTESADSSLSILSCSSGPDRLDDILEIAQADAGRIDQHGHVPWLVLVPPHLSVGSGDFIPRKDLAHAGDYATVEDEPVRRAGLLEILKMQPWIPFWRIQT